MGTAGTASRLQSCLEIEDTGAGAVMCRGRSVLLLDVPDQQSQCDSSGSCGQQSSKNKNLKPGLKVGWEIKMGAFIPHMVAPQWMWVSHPRKWEKATRRGDHEV